MNAQSQMKTIIRNKFLILYELVIEFVVGYTANFER